MHGRTTANSQQPFCQDPSGVLGCAEGSHKKNSFEVEVFVDDLTELVNGRNKEVAETAKKVVTKLKEEVEKKRSHVVSHRKW